MSDTSTFHWRDARERLGALADEHDLVLESGRRWFEPADGAALRVRPPLVFPIPADCAGLDDYIARLPERPGRHLVVLLQAGAAALGWCEGGEVVATKARKRYVVRGSGRAQPTHLSTKGKSRYGSRLRLRNARRLLEETNELLAAWWSDRGAPERIYVNAPKPLWASLFDVEPAPPFARATPTTRIPRDLPRPTTDVVHLAYKSLCFGRVEGA